LRNKKIQNGCGDDVTFNVEFVSVTADGPSQVGSLYCCYADGCRFDSL